MLDPVQASAPGLEPTSSLSARSATTDGSRTRPADSRLPVLLNLRGVAEHLGTSERHVRRLVQERRIPFIKVGHFVRFDPNDLAEWLDSARVAPAGTNPMLGILTEIRARRR